jgi:hypothetical protein
MSELARKLQLKEQVIRVVNRPPGVAPDLPVADDAEAVLVFVNDTVELDALGSVAITAARADRLAWIAYPKGGQRGTDLNRDILWARLADEGVRPVRQVSIDDVWSALRFRPA